MKALETNDDISQTTSIYCHYNHLFIVIYLDPMVAMYARARVLAREWWYVPGGECGRGILASFLAL